MEVSQNTEPCMLSHLTPLAIRAFNGTSFRPGKRGESLIREHSAELMADIKGITTEAEKFGVSATGAIEKYRLKYEKHLSAYLNSHSNIVSSMIAGPSNFPSERMQKRSRWTDNKYSEFRKWRSRALKVIKKSFSPKETPVTELEKARKDLETRQKQQEFMKAANKVVRAAKGMDCTEDLMNIQGMTSALARNLQIPDQVHGTGFAPYQLQNNNQNISRLKQRVTQLEKKAEKHINHEQQEIEINGIRFVENYEADRLQLFFPGRPTPDVIQILKKSGWHWSPSNQCWQRKITGNAIFSAKEILQLI